MKSAGPLSVAVALLLTAVARAQDTPDAAKIAADKSDTATEADKPYASIVARNMFGLLPLPPPDTNPPAPPVEPLPKITPNGIMTIFGRKEALFKVADKPKPGQPAKESTHCLGEGEMEDEITVVKINDADSIVTFNNHGVPQELPLVVASNSTGPAGPGGAPGAAPGNLGPGNPFAAGRQPMSPADRAAMRGRPAGGRVATPAQPGPGTTPAQATPSPSFSQPQASQPATIEDQVMNAAKEMAQIELNRIATQELVDKGWYPPLPPTMMTPPDATAHDGFPLIAPSEPVQPVPPPTNRR